MPKFKCQSSNVKTHEADDLAFGLVRMIISVGAIKTWVRSTCDMMLMRMPISPENYIFEVKDWRGRTVRLTKRTYETHEKRHPEFALYLESAKQTIQDPDFVAEADNGAISLFRFGLGHKPFESLYLVVIVYYEGEEGREATHHFQATSGDLPIIEHRHLWIDGRRFSRRA